MVAIRDERGADRERVSEILVAAFGRRNEADLVEALRQRARPHVSLVAEDGGRIVGHILLSPVELEPPGSAPAAGGLAPVAVDPGHQGRGVGSALIRAGVGRCLALGWRAVFLVGNPAVYARFGFAPAAPLGFSYANPLFDPALQVLELEPGALAGHAGRVVFHPAFAETGCG